ncbi:cysteine desulfurase family protein [Aequitasia blattaphilus]|uniref:cysteine desulfurase n=1 Tax=Aequitasia blattaphilus TaxID=2949332 RepID=A0ABT1EB38_9FIRM|nr:aminotransferase class V-fold PLP-dependent enzyme [Aequitasia blattaphilus]MCP1103055.1 aminotransferase class V-fold PLP-dependent enzyme [Aequitasia blattaphilus]MCR8615695.1 aminotransferase class V-fold PLP-dependent enzyme [Aequitasia blattaphilus]
MIYLNQAATSYPKPQRVQIAHAASLSAPPVGQYRSSLTAEKDIFDTCRENLGKLFGIEKDSRIFFASGATEASNVLIHGMDFLQKHVVTTATEHNSILRPLLNRKEGKKYTTIVGCDGKGRVDPKEIEKGIKEDTKAVFLNHCSNVTGMIQDVEAISRIAHEKGVLLILDASQSAGCIPINVDEWGVDGLIFTGHKSLFGSQGMGGYYLREEIALKPLLYGGTGLDSSRIIYYEPPYEYEVGTQNTPGIIALNEGVSYVLERGIENIKIKEQGLLREIYERLAIIEEITLYGSHQTNKGPVLSFNINGLNPSDVAYILQNGYNIVIRAGLHCAPLIHQYIGSEAKGTCRVSISDLTTEDDVEAFLSAIKDIVRSMG